MDRINAKARRSDQTAGNAGGAADLGGARGFDLDSFLDDDVATAQAGTAEASAALPFAAAIQRAFGHHDVGAVMAAVGGRAADACDSMGATAYAAGNRVAFAGTPDLHTAAHEAAHVVQQRGGVQLAGGVGASGDRYEQHADRVADLVVRGESAESELDAMASPSSSRASATAVQRHDSPGHIRIGDSVKGEGVTIKNVYFSPGELAALADFVGTVEELQKYSQPELEHFKFLLENRHEDVAAWDPATNGGYSDEAQKNEKHFAPSAGDGGANFRDTFILHYKDAIEAARGGDADAARLHGYYAEHYLEDAFSAGHQVAAGDVQKQVDAVIGYIYDEPGFITAIASQVYAKAADQIGHYGMKYFGMPAVIQIGQGQFEKLAIGGALYKGNDGVGDAVRRFVHENLADSNVEVTSKAHPAPFLLWGDHDLGNPAAKESVVALQNALADARTTLASPPAGAPDDVATKVFEKHCPVPTATGRQTVIAEIEKGTKDRAAIIVAVVDSMVDTILDVMDGLITMTSKPDWQLPFQVVLMNEPDREKHEFPDVDPHDPDGEPPVVGQPVPDRPSYVPWPKPPEDDAPFEGQPVEGDRDWILPSR